MPPAPSMLTTHGLTWFQNKSQLTDSGNMMDKNAFLPSCCRYVLPILLAPVVHCPMFPFSCSVSCTCSPTENVSIVYYWLLQLTTSHKGLLRYAIIDLYNLHRRNIFQHTTNTSQMNRNFLFVQYLFCDPHPYPNQLPIHSQKHTVLG